MSEYAIYVRIDSEPFLSRVRKYRDELWACHDAWRAFAEPRGASNIPDSPARLTGLYFDGKAPVGWKKPNRKGWSYPTKGHADEASIAALPKKPRTYDVFGDALCFDLNYKAPNGDSGGGVIGRFFFGPNIGWAGDVFYAVIPDAKKAADDHLARHPDHTITSGAAKWVLPTGLVKISSAQVDLLIAQARVSQEEADALARDGVSP